MMKVKGKIVITKNAVNSIFKAYLLILSTYRFIPNILRLNSKFVQPDVSLSSKETALQSL